MTTARPKPHLPPCRERRSPAERRDRGHFRHARRAVQLVVLALCVWSIVDYHRFVVAVTAGVAGDVARLRAPGFEAWTPIAALVSLVHLVRTGELDPIHPAGLLMMLGALAAALLVRGGFCGWICPVGTIMDGVARIGRALRLRRDAPPPRWLDLPLRGLRWVLLAFFAWGATAVGDYYYHVFDRYADVGMYGYWAWGRVGWVFLSILGVAFVGGLVVDRFWCRYLCPYGALTQLLARLSPWRVTRTPDACTDCGKCDRVCPALLPVSRSLQVTSSRCIGCGLCVAACPEKRALLAEVKLPLVRRRPRVGWLVTGAAAAAIFAAVPVWGILSGRWQTRIATAEYRDVIPRMKAGTFDRRHVLTQGGAVEIVGPKARAGYGPAPQTAYPAATPAAAPTTSA
ncbi:MAG TPA: 4Fe-4S binding protein, partial [Polyangia bacterium]